MPVVSFDLARKHYRDTGIAVLRQSADEIAVEFVRIELHGTPSPGAIAHYLSSPASSVGASLLLINGAQGWKDPSNGLQHSRACERELNTPAKTGIPGHVKPANYAPFVSFSIQVFDELSKLKWPRFHRSTQPPARAASGSFPLSAWRLLGLAPLPAKARTRPSQRIEHLAALKSLFKLHVASSPNHDELQALVAGLAGIAIERGQLASVSFTGRPPFTLDGTWREGLIVNPCI